MSEQFSFKFNIILASTILIFDSVTLNYKVIRLMTRNNSRKSTKYLMDLP